MNSMENFFVKKNLIPFSAPLTESDKHTVSEIFKLDPNELRNLFIYKVAGPDRYEKWEIEWQTSKDGGTIQVTILRVCNSDNYTLTAVYLPHSGEEAYHSEECWLFHPTMAPLKEHNFNCAMRLLAEAGDYEAAGEADCYCFDDCECGNANIGETKFMDELISVKGPWPTADDILERLADYNRSFTS